MQIIDPAAYLPIVRSVAATFRRRLGRPARLDDLIADGSFGLLRAIRQFDSSKCVPFEAFARLHIRRAILDGARERRWPSRPKGPFIPRLCPLSAGALAVDPPWPRADLRESLARALPALSRRRRLVVVLYHFEQMSMRQIARSFGITEARVSQLYSKAITQLRNTIDQPETRSPAVGERPRGR